MSKRGIYLSVALLLVGGLAQRRRGRGDAVCRSCGPTTTYYPTLAAGRPGPAVPAAGVPPVLPAAVARYAPVAVVAPCPAPCPPPAGPAPTAWVPPAPPASLDPPVPRHPPRPRRSMCRVR